MGRRHTLRWAFLACACGGLMFARPATADWPMARQNPQRTATAPGVSDIAIPVPFWRYYLGGYVAQSNLRPYDVDGNGTADLIAVTGGRAIAKALSDETLWESPALDLIALVDLTDLDGDGGQELVAYSASRVYVISVVDGSVQWGEPEGEMGTIRGVRVGDVDGDGVDDLIIGECGCCAVNSGVPGVVYSFAGDLTSPTRLWTFPVSACGASAKSLTLVNIDSEPGLEVVLGEDSRLSVVSGSTGAVVAATDALGTWMQRSECVGVDLDGFAGDELVCVLDSSFPPATNQRRAFALKYNATVSPGLQLLWDVSLAPDAGELSWVELVDDVTGDGNLEVVVSSKALDGVWTTTVLSAENGALIATIPSSIGRGSVPTLPGNRRALLTANGSDLSGWRIERNVPPLLLWTIPNADVIFADDHDARRSTRLFKRALVADVTGDGRPELFTRTLEGISTLTAYSTDEANAQPVGAFSLPSDQRLVNVWPTWSAPGLGVVAALPNDGVVRVLDRSLSPLASSDDVIAPGLRFGGYYLPGGWRDLQNTIVTGALDLSGADSVVARDSRGALVRIDTIFASFAAPPRPRWTKRDAFSPVILPNLIDGGPGVACFALEQPVTTDPEYLVEAITPAGQVAWSSRVPQQPLNDLLPGQFDSDSTPDLVFDWGSPGDTQVTKRAVSGATGVQLWDSAAVEAGCGRQPAGFSIGQWDSDSLDDVFYQANATRVISGADGRELASSEPGHCYFQPMLANLDADPRYEVTLQGGVARAQTFDDDLNSVLWTSSNIDKPMPYASLLECPSGTKLLVEGSWLYPARLKVTTLSGVGTGTEKTVVLAGGLSYASEADAAADGKALSQLGSIAGHSDLRGNQQPIALVGARDGWLYGYEPCREELVLVYQLGAPVGSPVFGDTDGDGKDEILVSVADGYLYALRNLTIAQPGFVWDIDPVAGITDRDVNTISTDGRLSAKWQAVPGAISYEVTIVTFDGEYLIEPFWRDVGNVTEVSLLDLPLENNSVYRFAVRAIAPQGRSVDAVSNGVVAHIPPASDAGPGDAGPSERAPAGCCNAGQRFGGSGWALLTLCLLFLRRRAG